MTKYVRVSGHHGHPRADRSGRVHEHVLVVEKAMGKSLRPTAYIHHVDQDPRNNANGNLCVCDSAAYHNLLHRRLRALEACGDPSARRCKHCKGYDCQEDIVQYAGAAPEHRSCKAKKERRRRAERAA